MTTHRPDLLALSAELDAHLARLTREVRDVESLAAAAVTDRTALWALAADLQAFYTACEAIVRRVIERFDGEVPHGPDAHVRLLQAAMRDIEGLLCSALG